jgi:hypothetical protein
LVAEAVNGGLENDEESEDDVDYFEKMVCGWILDGDEDERVCPAVVAGWEVSDDSR